MEGLPILESIKDAVDYQGLENCFNTPKGGRPSDTTAGAGYKRTLSRYCFNTPKGGRRSITLFYPMMLIIRPTLN